MVSKTSATQSVAYGCAPRQVGRTDESTITRLNFRRKVKTLVPRGAYHLYDELDDMAGKKARCRARYRTLAARCHVSEENPRQIGRWLALLKSLDLVRVRRTGRSDYFTLAWADPDQAQVQDSARLDDSKMSDQIGQECPNAPPVSLLAEPGSLEPSATGQPAVVTAIPAPEEIRPELVAAFPAHVEFDDDTVRRIAFLASREVPGITAEGVGYFLRDKRGKCCKAKSAGLAVHVVEHDLKGWWEEREEEIQRLKPKKRLTPKEADEGNARALAESRAILANPNASQADREWAELIVATVGAAHAT